MSDQNFQKAAILVAYLRYISQLDGWQIPLMIDYFRFYDSLEVFDKIGKSPAGKDIK